MDEVRRLVGKAIFAVLVSALGTPGFAACHLALVLALDVSTSVDEREYALQRDGLAAALNSPSVRSALFANEDVVAISAFEWSGRLQQTPVLEWTVIENEAALTSAIQTIRSTTRRYNAFPTAMGHALLHAKNLFASAPSCDRRTIDISGDGVTNDGMDPPWAYRWNDFGDITVNGLVIRTSDHRIPIYYEREVIRGPESFVEIADGYDDYERAMRRKLVREIGVMMLGQADPSNTVDNP